MSNNISKRLIQMYILFKNWKILIKIEKIWIKSEIRKEVRNLYNLDMFHNLFCFITNFGNGMIFKNWNINKLPKFMMKLNRETCQIYKNFLLVSYSHTYIHRLGWVNCHHFILLISHIHIFCFWFCQWHSITGSVWHLL